MGRWKWDVETRALMPALSDEQATDLMMPRGVVPARDNGDGGQAPLDTQTIPAPVAHDVDGAEAKGHMIPKAGMPLPGELEQAIVHLSPNDWLPAPNGRGHCPTETHATRAPSVPADDARETTSHLHSIQPVSSSPSDGLVGHKLLDNHCNDAHQAPMTDNAAASQSLNPITVVPPPVPDLGHAWCDAQTRIAEVKPKRRGRNGHRRSDNHVGCADLPLSLERLHETIGLYARTLLDIQDGRIAVSNRIKAVEKRDASAVLPENEVMAPIFKAFDAFSDSEKELERLLRHWMRQHPMRDWIDQQRGIGLPIMGRILSATGPLDQYATVSKLWKFMGMHVTPEGRAARREHGVHLTHTNCTFQHLPSCKPDCKTNHHRYCKPNSVGTAWSPLGRMLCFRLGLGIVNCRSGPYRVFYDQKRAEYLARERLGPSGCPFGHVHHTKPKDGAPAGNVVQCCHMEKGEWVSAHVSNAAQRYAVKQCLKDMWLEWRRVVPLS